MTTYNSLSWRELLSQVSGAYSNRAANVQDIIYLTVPRVLLVMLLDCVQPASSNNLTCFFDRCRLWYGPLGNGHCRRFSFCCSLPYHFRDQHKRKLKIRRSFSLRLPPQWNKRKQFESFRMRRSTLLLQKNSVASQVKDQVLPPFQIMGSLTFLTLNWTTFVLLKKFVKT